MGHDALGEGGESEPLQKHSVRAPNVGDAYVFIGKIMRERPQGIIAAVMALETNTSLWKLDLASNEIGDDGAIALANMLDKNATITQINLDYNSRIGKPVGLAPPDPRGMGHICYVLDLRGCFKSIYLVESSRTNSEKLKLVFFIFKVFLSP